MTYPLVQNSFLVAPLCPTLCEPMDCSPPGYSREASLVAQIVESLPPIRIPWTAEPDGLQSMPLQKSGTQLSDSTIITSVLIKIFEDMA